MEIDFIQELKKRDELLDGYLRQIEIQEEFIQKQKERMSRGSYLKDHRYRRQCLAGLYRRKTYA